MYKIKLSKYHLEIIKNYLTTINEKIKFENATKYYIFSINIEENTKTNNIHLNLEEEEKQEELTSQQIFKLLYEKEEQISDKEQIDNKEIIDLTNSVEELNTQEIINILENDSI